MLLKKTLHEVSIAHHSLQEEQKVSALSEKLSELGVDVEALLASIKPEEEEEEENEGQ